IVNYVSTQDAAGNTRFLTTSDLASGGFPNHLTVGDPAILPNVSGIVPATGTVGGTVAASIPGSNLGSATAVTFSGTGVTAQSRSGGTNTALPVSIVASSTATTGPRPFTVTTPN